jgi:antirestriction protein ArdC
MATATKTKSNTRHRKTTFKDTYADVTTRVLEALESGTVLWHKPWRTAVEMPTSLSTNKAYRGINIFLLMFESMEKGYNSPYWGTYRQITERGGQVRKGEKSTEVVFWKILHKNEEVDGQLKEKKIPMLRTYNVFNTEQADWAEDAKLPKMTERAEVDPVEAAEAVVAEYLATGPTLRHGGGQAFYRPGTDTIQMPLAADFKSNDHYYSTLYHEVTHSTGNSKRLAREGIADGSFGSFGDAVYSKEELVAEMGAAMLSAVAGLDQVATIPATAAYLAHWRDALKGDNKLIVQAAAQAQKAVDLVLGTTFDTEKEES